MKTYSVKDISRLLNTNDETVRRWIRTGKLLATSNSKKQGNIVTVDEFNRFVKSSPKYSAIIATMATSSIPMAVIMGAVIGSIMGLKNKSPKKNINAVDIEKMLNEKINTHQAILEKKKVELARLQGEIDAEELNIQKYQAALTTLDLNEIANEVNTSTQQEELNERN